MSASSLLSFLDAPVVVGDPDGCAAYVNPAFETLFSVSAETVTGQPLASLFEGGVREAVLQAVAEVCSVGKSARFRVRHNGLGYVGLASPIVAEDERVGFVILLSESAPDDERALALQRQLREPLGEVTRVLDELGDADGARRSALLEDGLRAVGRMRKTFGELGAVLGGARGSGNTTAPNTFDPARVVGDVSGRLSSGFAQSSVGLEVRVPATLPSVQGDPRLLAEAVKGLLESRLVEGEPGTAVVLSARVMERTGAPAVIIAVLDRQDADALSEPGEAEPELVRRAVRALGGELRTTADPASGRVTAIRLPALKG